MHSICYNDFMTDEEITRGVKLLEPYIVRWCTLHNKPPAPKGRGKKKVKKQVNPQEDLGRALKVQSHTWIEPEVFYDLNEIKAAVKIETIIENLNERFG